MNKKKFFATCTLVAFGAAMVPAMAFAAGTPVSALSTMAFVGDDSFTAGVTGSDGLQVTFDKESSKWVDVDGDTLYVALNGKNVTSDFEIPDGGITEADASNGAKVVLKAKSKTILSSGTYEITMKNTKFDASATPIEDGNEEVSFFIKTNAPKALTVTSGAKVEDGELTNGAKVGTIEFAESITKSNVYDLGVNGYAPLLANAKKLANVTADTANKKLSVSDLKTAMGDVNPVGHTFALADATISSTTYPAEYFTYTKEVDDVVTAAAKVAQDQVDADWDKLPNEIEIEIPGTPSADISVEAVIKAKITSFETENKIFVDAGSKHIVKDVCTNDVYSAASNKNIPQTTQSTLKNDILDNGGSLTEQITVVIQNDTTNAISEIKDITVTLVSEKSGAEKKAAFAKELDTYDEGKKSDINDDKGTLTVTKVGDVFPAGATSVTINANRDFRKLFDANNKLTKLPEKDMTGEVVFGFGAADADGKITVTVTIKAGGSEQPSDKEEAAKVVIEKAATFDELVVAAGAEVDDTEFAAILTAYMELLQAYMAYVQIA